MSVFFENFLRDVHELEIRMLDSDQAAKQAWNEFNQKWIVYPLKPEGFGLPLNRIKELRQIALNAGGDEAVQAAQVLIASRHKVGLEQEMLRTGMVTL